MDRDKQTESPGGTGRIRWPGGGCGGAARGVLVEQFNHYSKQFDKQHPGRSPSSASAAATASSGASSTGAGVSALLADVNKYAAKPSFSDYGPNYGGKIPSIANLAGKKIMIIPGVSALAACEEIAQAASDYRQGRGHGADDLRQPGLDGRAQHRDRERDPPGIRGDHHGLRDGPVDQRAGDRPGAEGRHRGGRLRRNPGQDQRAGTTYNTDDPYALDAKLAAEQAIEQHNGQPFNAIAITSTATGPATAIEEAAIKAELAKD